MSGMMSGNNRPKRGAEGPPLGDISNFEPFPSNKTSKMAYKDDAPTRTRKQLKYELLDRNAYINNKSGPFLEKLMKVEKKLTNDDIKDMNSQLMDIEPHLKKLLEGAGSSRTGDVSMFFSKPGGGDLNSLYVTQLDAVAGGVVNMDVGKMFDASFSPPPLGVTEEEVKKVLLQSGGGWVGDAGEALLSLLSRGVSSLRNMVGMGGDVPPLAAEQIAAQKADRIRRVVRLALLSLPVYMIGVGAYQGTVGFMTAQRGLEAVLSGECSGLTARLWSTIGLGNPVCDQYNSIMLTIYRAMSGNLTDLMLIGACTTTILSTPHLFGLMVNIISSIVAQTLSSTNAVTIDPEVLRNLQEQAVTSFISFCSVISGLGAAGSSFRALAPGMQNLLGRGLDQPGRLQLQTAAGLVQRQDVPQDDPARVEAQREARARAQQPPAQYGDPQLAEQVEQAPGEGEGVRRRGRRGGRRMRKSKRKSKRKSNKKSKVRKTKHRRKNVRKTKHRRKNVRKTRKY